MPSNILKIDIVNSVEVKEQGASIHRYYIELNVWIDLSSFRYLYLKSR